MPKGEGVLCVGNLCVMQSTGVHFVSGESGVTEMPGLGWGVDYKC